MSSADIEADDAELTLYRLDEIDDLLRGNEGSSDEDEVSQSTALTQYLMGGEDIETALRRHDEQLRKLRDSFIAAHVQQAEQIGKLYHEFDECEQHIVQFDEEILSFQRKLERSANDIVMMQQQTDGLVRKLNNRRQVSSKINEVYNALQKCDFFCEEISSRDVDPQYLANLRELDKRLSFLSGNKALQHSAVDNEIRPKLTSAAHKAGDKLQRFFTKRITALTEDPAHATEQQQFLEENAQFAFRFLQLYNPPVSKGVTRVYIKQMSASYAKQFRALLAWFSEASEVHAHPIEPLVSAEEVQELLSNRDKGSPTGNQVSPAPFRFPGRAIARRERSVSQHMRGLTDFISTSGGVGGPGAIESLRQLRPATFSDTARAMDSLSVRYGKLHVEKTCADQLDQCNSWTWQFVRCFRTLVNTCEEECRFIGNFFCVVGDVEGAEDYTNAECIARSVLGPAVAVVETSIMEDLPLVMDRAEVLASLRVLETMKQHLCTSRDPIPLLLLSSILEISKSALRRSLRLVLSNDRDALSFLPTLKPSLFYRAPSKDAYWLDILGNKAFCAALGVHPLLSRVCTSLAQLEYLNTTMLRCSSYDSSDISAFDPFVGAFLKKALMNIGDFAGVLACRFVSPLTKNVFQCVNIYSMMLCWSEFTASRVTGAEQQQQRRNSISSPSSTRLGESKGFPDEEEELPGLPSEKRGAASLSPQPGSPARGTTAPLESVSHLQYLDDQLHQAILALVATELQANKRWRAVVNFVEAAEKKFDVAFFTTGSQPASTTKRETTPPPGVSEETVASVVTELSAGWAAAARESVQGIRQVIAYSLGRSGGPSAASGASPSQRCTELSTLICSSLFDCIMTANTKLTTIVVKCFSSNRELQSKLVNSTTLLHELNRILSVPL